MSNEFYSWTSDFFALQFFVKHLKLGTYGKAKKMFSYIFMECQYMAYCNKDCYITLVHYSTLLK